MWGLHVTCMAHAAGTHSHLRRLTATAHIQQLTRRQHANTSTPGHLPKCTPIAGTPSEWQATLPAPYQNLQHHTRWWRESHRSPENACTRQAVSTCVNHQSSVRCPCPRRTLAQCCSTMNVPTPVYVQHTLTGVPNAALAKQQPPGTGQRPTPSRRQAGGRTCIHQRTRALAAVTSLGASRHLTPGRSSNRPVCAAQPPLPQQRAGWAAPLGLPWSRGRPQPTRRTARARARGRGRRRRRPRRCIIAPACCCCPSCRRRRPAAAAGRRPCRA
jgi:hypothetical protein